MREFKLKNKGNTIACPKCNNEIQFKAFSEQVAEDSCEVWVECGVCGYDPTKDNTDYRLEDVWGGTDNCNCLGALECWNEAIEDLNKTKTELLNKISEIDPRINGADVLKVL